MSASIPAIDLANYSILLLDVGRTFMFGMDRFGQGENYAQTYTGIGGQCLCPDQVNVIIRGAVRHFHEHYTDPASQDNFPSVAESLQAVAPTIAKNEQRLLAEVIAIHECGTVPDAHAEAIKKLAQSHRLVIISNIWSDKARWLAEFARQGIESCFERMVFSSDGNSIKPSLRFFERAISGLDVATKHIAMIGDDLQRDIAPANQLGMATVWIRPGDRRELPTSLQRTFQIASLVDLVGEGS